MKENIRIEEQYEEIDLMELLGKLFRNWKFILKWCAVAAVIALVVGFSIPKEYEAGAKLAPEVVSRTNNNISSVAALAGINLNNTSTSDAVYPELYPEIVGSYPFIIELFSEPVTFMYKKEVVETDLYTYFKEYTRSPWWSYVFSAPFKALGWFMSLFSDKDEEPVEGYADINPASLTREQQAVAMAITDAINLTVDNKTSVISASISTQDPAVSVILANAVVQRLQEYVSAYRTEKSRQDVVYYQQLYDESKASYYTAQKNYARYVDANQGVVRRSVLIEQDRLQNEMQLTYNLYSTCAQQLQAAKAKVQQETPVFTVIAPPTTPLHASKPSKMMILVAFVFLGAVISAVWVLWGRGWRDNIGKSKEKDTPAPVSTEVKEATEKKS